MTDAEVFGLEQATAAAVSPAALEELDGWLLAFDRGSINRAKSAAPLQHTACDHAVLGRIEARYLAHGLTPLFRLPVLACFDELRRELSRRAYVGERPTEVQYASTRVVQAAFAGGQVDIETAPDAAWAALFLGDGADPQDGASRVASLGRAPGSLYASVRQGGSTVAAGAAAFSHGWASVHGMRTHAAHRRRGWAGRVLAALASAALARGQERLFLQVEAGNDAALALYRRAGFKLAWRYEYWRPV